MLKTGDPGKSYELAKKQSSDAKGALGELVGAIMMALGTEADFDFIAEQYDDASTQDKIDMTDIFCDYLAKINDTEKIKKGVDYILKFRGFIPDRLKNLADPTFRFGLSKVSKAKPGAVADYIKNVYR